MRRREFLGVLGGAVGAAWPVVLRGQQAMPVIGFIGVTSLEEWKRNVDAFHEGLKEAGFVVGQNVAIDYRWAEGHYDRLPGMVTDMVSRKVNVIVAIAPPAALAVKAGNPTIPAVFFMGSDPVKLGVVTSLNHPGGNITGVSMLANLVGPKRLQIMREIVSAPAVYALLLNPTNQNAEPDTREMMAAARATDQSLIIAKASTDAEIDTAFANFAQSRVGALIVNPDPFLLGRRERIVSLALRSRLPTIFHTPEPVVAGGLMSYGSSFPDGHRQVGRYTGRMLKGEKPADLPVMQSTTFEMVINLKTARAIGVELPSKLLFTADEVIE